MKRKFSRLAALLSVAVLACGMSVMPASAKTKGSTDCVDHADNGGGNLRDPGNGGNHHNESNGRGNARDPGNGPGHFCNDVRSFGAPPGGAAGPPLRPAPRVPPPQP